MEDAWGLMCPFDFWFTDVLGFVAALGLLTGTCLLGFTGDVLLALALGFLSLWYLWMAQYKARCSRRSLPSQIRHFHFSSSSTFLRYFLPRFHLRHLLQKAWGQKSQRYICPPSEHHLEMYACKYLCIKVTHLNFSRHLNATSTTLHFSLDKSLNTALWLVQKLAGSTGASKCLQKFKGANELAKPR